MREIAELGYDHIWMSDDLFTLNYKRTFELAKAIEDAHLPLTWECLSRVTHVDQALFEQMHRRDASASSSASSPATSGC
jgi:sugar phosphate isomerase/epimerase